MELGGEKNSDLLLLNYSSLYICAYVCYAQSLSRVCLRPYGAHQAPLS